MAYKDALHNWSVESYVQFRLTETANRWIKRELGSIPLKEIGRLMHEYVEAGGVIDEVRETRPEWSDFDYHYDLRFKIKGKRVYFETRLKHKIPVLPDESIIIVVNIHDP